MSALEAEEGPDRQRRVLQNKVPENAGPLKEVPVVCGCEGRAGLCACGWREGRFEMR